MSGMNVTYDYGLGVNLATATVKALALVSTGTYTPSASDHYLSEVSSGGGVECSASGYARAAMSSESESVDGVNHKYVIDYANFSFGSPAAGQTIIAIVYYAQIGGDDSTPADDILLRYDGLDSNGDDISVATNGTEIKGIVNASGWQTRQKAA